MISFHLPAHPGAAPIHLDEWFDQPVSLDGYWLRREDLLPPLAAAGLHEEAYLERHPLPAVEYPSTRGYLLLRKCHTPRAQCGCASAGGSEGVDARSVTG